MTVVLNIVCVVILIAVPVIIIASIVQAIRSSNSHRKGLFLPDITATFTTEEGDKRVNTYHVTVEVEELSQNNNYSKIKILSIGGIPKFKHENVKDLIGTLVKTDSVLWNSKNDA